MDIVFLGTASMTPTAERAQSTVLIRQSGEHLLFDCGENTQRQMRIAGFAVPKIKRIFLSHWHGDHVLGLPGVFENIGKWGAEKKITIYGPRGSAKRVQQILEAFGITGKIEVDVQEITVDGVAYKGRDFVVETQLLQHSIPCVGYAVVERDRRKMDVAKVKKLEIPLGPILGRLQNGEDIVFEGKKIKAKDVTFIVKGKKVVYLTDSVYCSAAVKLAKGADVLICESTYDAQGAALAKEYMHMTSLDAARIAKKAGVKKLVLTHFSQRYKDAKPLELQAKKIFKNVVSASDFLSFSV